MDIFHGYEEYESKLISLRTVNILYIVVNAITDEIVRNAVHHRSYLHADKLAHFSKYFKDKTEETFSKYLRRVRLEHAIDDLRNKKITVRQAAKIL